MPHYIKVCPICFSQFYAVRLSQTYCKKQCLNKSRSIPHKLLQALIEKSAMALQVVPIVPKAVKDFIKNNPDLAKYADTASANAGSIISRELQALGISVDDQAELLRNAKKLKEQRRKEELDKEFNKERQEQQTQQTPVLSDPEMENFKL